jgi:hypothetical protein
MTVEHRYDLRSENTDGFTQTLNETANYFMQQNHVSILGEGFRDILTDNSLYQDYANKLTEGMDADEAAQIRQLLENNRTTIINESAVAGIPPITSLAQPTIRKMWAKIALKYAVPTQPVKTPAFSVSFSRPYIQDAETGKKHHLPEALREFDNGLAEKRRLSKEVHALPLQDKDLLAQVGATAQTGDAIDRNFSIQSVTVEVPGATAEVPAETKVVEVRSKMDINLRLYAEVTAKHSDGTVVTDTLLGSVDPERGTVKAIALNNAIKGVEFFGYVSSESHNRATNVSFDIERRDINIGTGEHIEASLPLEMLTDTMAMYNVDGAAEVVDVMSNITAQKVDQEIYAFLDNSFRSNPTYRGKFNVHPPAQFAGNPKNWLEEIKRVIDYLATKLKSETYYYNGRFVIVGNPLDTQLIPNVSWTFNHVSDQQNGIDVDYSIGAMSGANRYTIVASDLIPQGELTMFFVPTTEKFITMKYYPYTFNVVNNYLNTQNPNIPSVMMTKRHTIEEFLPMVCKIEILNNNGTLAAASQFAD